MAVCQQRERFPSTPELLHSFAVELSIFKLFKEEAAIFLKKDYFSFTEVPLVIYISLSADSGIYPKD